MKIKKPLTLSAILLAGIGIGRLLPRGAADTSFLDEGASPAAHASGNPARNGGAAEERIVRRRAGVPRERDNAVAAGQNDPEEGMALVPTALIGELSLAAGTRTAGQELFSRDGRIEEALRITDHEKAVIQTAWRDSLQRIRDLETASMQTEQIDEWSTRVTVPDLSPSMTSLRDEFRSTVDRALGGSRSEAFLAAKQTSNMFSPPSGDRSYTVTSEAAGDGQWRFRIMLAGPGGSRVWVGESIPNEIRHLFGDIKLVQ